MRSCKRSVGTCCSTFGFDAGKDRHVDHGRRNPPSLSYCRSRGRSLDGHVDGQCLWDGPYRLHDSIERGRYFVHPAGSPGLLERLLGFENRALVRGVGLDRIWRIHGRKVHVPCHQRTRLLLLPGQAHRDGSWVVCCWWCPRLQGVHEQHGIHAGVPMCRKGMVVDGRVIEGLVIEDLGLAVVSVLVRDA